MYTFRNDSGAIAGQAIPAAITAVCRRFLLIVTQSYRRIRSYAYYKCYSHLCSQLSIIYVASYRADHAQGATQRIIWLFCSEGRPDKTQAMNFLVSILSFARAGPTWARRLWLPECAGLHWGANKYIIIIAICLSFSGKHMKAKDEVALWLAIAI